MPFQCEVGELESLFSTFGDLKSCRMPKLPSGRHRGFGFVEYSTASDAKAAFEALKLSTHIYGRYYSILFLGLIASKHCSSRGSLV